MTRRIGLALLLMTALLYVMAVVQDLDEQMESGEFQRNAMHEYKELK